MSKNRLAVLGLTAGLLAGGAAGVALGVPAVSGAQDTTTEQTVPESGTEEAPPEHGQWLSDTLAPLVENGTITQEQADAVIAALREARPEGRGPGGPLRERLGAKLDAAASALGMTADELRAELQGGSNLAEVAEARGVDVQAVIDALVADLETKVAEKLAAGDITQEQADEILANANERVTAMVNGEGPRGGPGRHRHPADDAEDDSDTETPEAEGSSFTI